jgi:fructosamine-3-kinase
MTAAVTAVTAVTALTGLPAVAAEPLGGATHRVRLADGSSVVAKRHDHPSAVRAEVAGLRWLTPTPDVRAHDDEWLVTTWIEPVRASTAAAEGFGRALAALHRAGAPAFGSPPPDGPADAWIGLAPMRNAPGADWPAWYAEHRVLPYVRTAVDHGALADAGPFTAVCERLAELAGPEEAPARVHGDLWHGNVVWGDDRAWLIDPAAHGGHRETDLAMLRLFGCAHLDRIVAAYDEAAPLADGWRDRVALHQLFPLLVHTVLFGGGYGEQAVAAARRALRTGL